MGMGGGSNRAQREAEAQERQRQEAIRSGTERVRSTFASPERQAQIGEFVNATRSLLTGELNKQQGQAVRGNKFALARSGQLGGSLQVDRSRQLGETYGRGLLEAERRAQSAGADLRGADEDAQARLIGLVQGGLDATTAAQQAAQSMRSNLAAGSATRSVNDLGNVFGSFGDYFQQSRDAAARRRADQQFSPTGLYTPMFGGGRP
jgi:hypothetical protein